MAEDTYTPREGAANTDSTIGALAVELRSRMVVAGKLEDRLRREGVGDDERELRMRETWAACDALSKRIAALPPRTLTDLEAKAAAFLWLDGGVSSGDEDPQARLVADVMTFLAGGVSDFLAPAYRDPPLDAPTLFAGVETQALVARAASTSGLLALHDVGRALREAAARRDAAQAAEDAGAVETLGSLEDFGRDLEDGSAERLGITQPRTAAEARGRAIALYVREARADVPDSLERAARAMFRLGFDLPAG